jgi:hypothetical protein
MLRDCPISPQNDRGCRCCPGWGTEPPSVTIVNRVLVYFLCTQHCRHCSGFEILLPCLLLTGGKMFWGLYECRRPRKTGRTVTPHPSGFDAKKLGLPDSPRRAAHIHTRESTKTRLGWSFGVRMLARVGTERAENTRRQR